MSDTPAPLASFTPEPNSDFADLNSLGYFAEAQLVRALHLKTRRALWMMRKEKTGIPYSKIGRLVVYKVADVQRYIEQRRQATLVPRVPKAIRQELGAVGLKATRVPPARKGGRAR